MARTDNLTNFLTDVATAIKTKKGDETPILASNFDTEITNLPAGSSKYAPRYISFRDYTGTELDEEVANLDTSNMTTMAGMFYGCRALTSLDLKNFNTSNVTNMKEMFYACMELTSVDLKNFDTSNVTNMNAMFRSTDKLASLDLSNFNTSKVTDMAYMFNFCYKLASLNLKNFDTHNVTNMTSLFSSCGALQSLDLSSFDMSKVSDTSSMFMQCSKLTSISFGSFDTSNVQSMSTMFYRVDKITSLPQFNADKVHSISGVLQYTTSLETFGGFLNLGSNYYTGQSANNSNYKLDVSTCTALTHDSLMNIINGLYDIKTKGCKAQSLVLGATNLAKLTEDEVAIATNKGWTVS